MAGLEMEMEVAPQLGPDGQADEDLIDYDTDTEEQSNAQDSADNRDLHQANRASVDANESALVGQEQDVGQGAHDMGPPERPKTGHDQAVDRNDDIELIQEKYKGRSSADEPPSNELQTGGDYSNADQPLEREEGGTVPVPGAEGQEASHEIDYDDVDTAEGAYVGTGDEAASETRPTDPSKHAGEGPETAQYNGPTTGPAEDDEIHWAEEGDGVDADAPASTDPAAYDHGVFGDGYQRKGHEQQPNVAQEDDAGGDFDFDHDANTAEEYQGTEDYEGEGEGMVAGNTSDPSDSHDDLAPSADSEFPDIVVQYKGEGFPLFSHSSDGFFSELSVLEDNMESVLAGFRTELANEIAPEDELVFQLDEVGLEFSESCSRDILCATTLRQVLEIFELLVKNQDPDSSRTLYAYVFTKPSASRRYEYLVECATAGKGLDEVIHLFGSPNNPSRAGSAEALHEQLDDFESDNDESGEPMQAEDGEGEEEELEHADDQFELVEAEVEYPDGGGDVGDAAQESAGLEGTEAPPGYGNADRADRTGALESAQALTNPLTDAHTLNESNPFMTFDMDEPGEEGGVNIGDEFGAAADAGINDVSTTDTLQNDEETASNLLDAIASTNEEGDMAGEVLADHDELAEIDWRDEPEPTEPAPDTPSGTGKRARTDDELGIEDEQDVKRRRP